jgi:hypothetical protein
VRGRRGGRGCARSGSGGYRGRRRGTPVTARLPRATAPGTGGCVWELAISERSEESQDGQSARTTLTRLQENARASFQVVVPGSALPGFFKPESAGTQRDAGPGWLGDLGARSRRPCEIPRWLRGADAARRIDPCPREAARGKKAAAEKDDLCPAGHVAGHASSHGTRCRAG